MARSKKKSMCSYELRAPVRRLVAVIATILAAALSPAAAHDIPNDVKVNAFLRPAGDRLELLMRVPMQALIEVEFPMRGVGYIDLPRVEEALRGAVKLYITDNITVYE